MDPLRTALENVTDEASFLAFAHLLLRDRRDAANAEHLAASSPHELDEGWANVSIEQFLAGAIGWAEDAEFGRRHHLEHATPWRLFAQFLYAGRMYQ